jgi:23S rRNA-/tRNA-specific pseudouridylate synthase
LVYGGPEANSGIIDAPIGRRPLPSLLRYVTAEGKPSVTEFTVLHRAAEHCLLALRPVTGRTHQLRVHCAHMGFPILGDPQYASEASAVFSGQLGLKGQLLGAYSLRFPHPVTGEEMELRSQMDTNI